MRVPLATDLSTRDGTCTKDAKIVNGFVESKGDSAAVFKRPGSVDLGAVGTGTAQALACWDGQLKSIVGDTLADLVITQGPNTSLWDYGDAYEGAAPRSVAIGGGYFVATYGSTFSRASTDGLTYGSAIAMPEPSKQLWTSVAYGNGKFISVGQANSGTGNPSKTAISTDGGVTWSYGGDLPYGGVGANIGWYSIVYTGSLFIAAGKDFSGAVAIIATSPDGVTWTGRTVTGNASIASIAVGSSLIVAHGNNTQLVWYSTNGGTSWSSATLPSGTWYGVAYNNGKVLAFGDGVTAYTVNGSSWTSGAAITLSSVVSVSNRFIGANDTTIQSSADGITWRDEYSPSIYGDGGGGLWTFYGLYTDGIKLYVSGYTTPDIEFSIVASCDVANIVTVVSTDVISAVTANADFFLESTGAAASTQYLMLKNSSQGFLYDGTTLSTITDVDYPGIHTVAVSSITRSSSTATVTTTAAHPFITGDSVLMAGAVETEYNGTFAVTVVDSTHFTYTVTGTPTTPATGTITARGGSKRTVPGIAYLDGYFFVMDEDAVIRNCALGDPTTWSGLDFIKAEKEPGLGKAISKSQNYVIAFKDWSTEFFYDAANAVGSPLSPVDNGFVLIGCASGESVVNLDGTLIWISKTKQAGKSVHLMAGLQPVEIATPDVQRVLNGDDLSTVHAYGVKISGHAFYVLTLVSSDITLAYDLISKTWQQWSSLTLNGSSVNVTSITQSAGTATVTTVTAHGLNDGDPVKIAGANQSAYNGNKQVQVVSSTVFTFHVDSSTTTPATGTITATGYTESYFKYTKYVACNGLDLVLHESDGHLYELTEDAYQDADLPIDVLIRTGKLDDGTTNFKTVSKAEVIGNKVDSTALIRWSDDDYATSSSYRPIDLNAERSVTRRCGGFRRRSFDIRHCGNTPLQLAALELDTAGG